MGRGRILCLRFIGQPEAARHVVDIVLPEHEVQAIVEGGQRDGRSIVFGMLVPIGMKARHILRDGLPRFTFLSIVGLRPALVKTMPAIVSNRRGVTNAILLRVDLSAAQRQAQGEILRRRVLESLVDERLLIQQAQQLKLGVTSEEIDRAIDEIRRQNGVDMDELTKALKAQGMTMAQYRQDLRKQILRLKVINAAVRSRITVSDEEIKAYYEQNVRRMGVQRSVRASHVFLVIPESATPQEVERRRRFGVELVQRARGGEDFAKLAKEFSEDPGSKDKGGEYTFPRGQMVPEFEAAADDQRANAGDIAGPSSNLDQEIAGRTGRLARHVPFRDPELDAFRERPVEGGRRLPAAPGDRMTRRGA